LVVGFGVVSSTNSYKYCSRSLSVIFDFLLELTFIILSNEAAESFTDYSSLIIVVIFVGLYLELLAELNEHI